MKDVIIALIVITALVVGFFAGVDHGWKKRIKYEAHECLQYGYCFRDEPLN